MPKNLLSFCNFCFEKQEKVLLYIFKSDVKLLQEILISDCEYENDYIILKTDYQEEFMIMLAGTKFHLRLKPDLSNVQYPDFPREKDWGRKIVFEIIDEIHGEEIVYSIGTDNESLLQEYTREYIS